jgi:hypothetical protein
VVLFLFLALAIDMGHIYAERRRCQNAADAGALAGARERCFEPQWMTTWKPKALAYANQNLRADYSPTVDPYLENGDWWVTVDVMEVVDTYIAGIIGMDTVNVGATATAACGGATSGCGLWPVTFSEGGFMNIYDELGCGAEFYVWNGKKNDEDPTEDILLDCDVCDCDEDGDGVEEIIGNAGRAWVDFTDVVDDQEYPDHCAQSSGCGESEIKCWVTDDSGTKITLPACIPGTRGTKAGAHKDVEDRAKSSDPYVSIPLYNGTGCGANTCGAHGTTFSIENLGCVEVLDWKQQLDLDYLNGDKHCFKGKAIRVAIACGMCDTNCGSTDGTAPAPWEVRAVSLIQ